MPSIRQKLSERLIASGSRVVLEMRQMQHSCPRPNCRGFSAGDVQVMGALDVLSSTAIWLGMRLMPPEPPIL